MNNREVNHYYVALIAILSILVVGLFLLSLSAGPTWINPLETLTYMFSGEQGSDEERLTRLIVMEIRLPRAILGLFIGGILGLSGAVLQGLLRNPLAEPGLLGVSACASLGAVVAIYSGLTALYAYALPFSALSGALIAVLLLYFLAGKSASILTIILAGVALSSLAGALTSLTLNLSSNPFATLEMVFWLLGSLTDRSMVHVGLALPFILLGMLLLLMTGRALDALSLGEDVALSLGVNMKRTRALSVIGTAVGVGAATAVSGAIGFVGLIVPHVLRPLVGNKPSRLLPVSALGGAVFLLAADILVRVVLPYRDLKLGAITAIIGAPFFFWLLIDLRRRML